MLHGRLDTITSSGYVEGWAFNGNAPHQPLTVSLLAGSEVVGEGIANRYRTDLADAGYTTGWCAFRLKLSRPVGSLHGQFLSLLDVTSHTEIFRTSSLPLSEESEAPLSTMEDVVLSDPSLVHSIEQLRGCDHIFAEFIDANGVNAFVKSAYLYILGRSADDHSRIEYTSLLRSGSIAPYDLLKALHDSEEFRSGPKLLMAPSTLGFAFHRQ